MSINTFSNQGLFSRTMFSTVPNVSSNSNVWLRHPAWTQFTAPGETDEKFIGLHIVNEDSNFVALSAAGNYTVDWGDGVVENYNADVVAYHEYNYSNANLADTNGPVTFQGSADTVTRTNHGFTNGMRVTFYNIVSTPGINEGQIYYVRDATTNTFKISSTINGSAIDLVSGGSATLLPYKQALVQVYPQAGQSLTSLKLHQKHNKTNLQPYTSGFVDIAVAGPSLTTLTIGVGVPGRATQNIYFYALEQVNLVKTNLRDLERLFYACYALQNVVGISVSTSEPVSKSVTFTDAGDAVTCAGHGLSNLDPVYFTQIIGTTGISTYTRYWATNTTADTFTLTDENGSAIALTTNGSGTLLVGTTVSYLFQACSILKSVPLFNTAAVINMNSMFYNCYALQSVPLFNTAAVTNMNFMFGGCYSLQSVPLFNTAAVTNMIGVFQGCYVLKSVPLFNTAAVTNMGNMFTNCYALQSVPLFNTAAVTNMNFMFGGCYSLQSVPLFNTAAVTNMGNMFANCYSLQSVPLFNTPAVTSMSGMFSNCYALQSVPLFNTAAVTNMGNMFANCYSLQSVPLFNTPAVTSMSGMFSNCYALQSVPLFNTAAVTNMSTMFYNCYALQSVPLFNTAAVTNMGNMFANCYSLQSVPLFNTAAVTSMSAMFSNCRSLQVIPALSASAGTSSSSYTNMFSNCANLSRIKITGFKYTFSVASCKLSATALDELYTNLATVTGQTITVSSNHGTDADTPSIATAKGWTVTG